MKNQHQFLFKKSQLRDVEGRYTVTSGTISLVSQANTDKFRRKLELERNLEYFWPKTEQKDLSSVVSLKYNKLYEDV